MAEIAFRHSVFALAMTGLLAGCVAPGGGGDGTAAFSPATSAKPGDDVEAPEVFQVTDTALWDGRPSLGGIWVASPDAVDPERVLMENLATGLTVEGALFRRERENPGPALQISSDAAEALGILAGQPIELRVTALRRAEPEVPVQAEVPAEVPATDLATDAEPVDAGTGATADAGAEGTAAVAAAALAEADGTAAPTDPATGAEAGAEAGTEPVAEVVPKTAKERRAEAKAEREAKRAAAKAAKAAAAVAAADTVEGADPGTIETAPLDARSAEVSAAAAAAAEPTPTVEVETPAAAAPAAEPGAVTEAPAEVAVEAPAGTARPIQIASFSQEENATRAVGELAKIGVTAQVRKTEVGGKAVWGIVATGDVAMLKSIRGAGYPDAYFLQ